MNPPTTRPCWEIFSVGNRSAPWLHSGSFVSSPWLGRTFIELIPCWFPAQWIYHLRIYFYQSFTVLLGCWGNCGQTFQLHSLYWARRPRWKDLALWNCCHGQISSPWSSRPTFNVWILHVFLLQFVWHMNVDWVRVYNHYPFKIGGRTLNVSYILDVFKGGGWELLTFIYFSKYVLIANFHFSRSPFSAIS